MLRPLFLSILFLLIASQTEGEQFQVAVTQDGDVRRDSSSYTSGSSPTLSLADKQTAEEDCYSCYLFFTCCDPYTAYRERLIYLEFGLSQLTDKCLQSATLSLVREGGDSPQGNNNLIYLRRTASSWSENTLSWSSKGSVSVIEQAQAQLFQNPSPDTYTLDVPITFLESAINSGFLSLQVELNNGGSSNVQTQFHSKDSSLSTNHPILTVQYESCVQNAACSPQRTCLCLNGFELVGQSCLDVDDCAVTPAPCVHGNCTNDGEGTGRISCACEEGWEGVNCDKDIDECSKYICGPKAQNCINSPGSFTCQCHQYWHGPLCDEDILECSSDPCQNGGTCDEVIGGPHVCSCPPGFAGPDCSTEITTCADDPCVNGECYEVDNVVGCNCTDGYEGELCEKNIDDCPEGNVCNNGTCVDQQDTVNEYQCLCERGYTGDTCATPIDYCASSQALCLNGALCQNLLLTFSCLCPSGFQGSFCQYDIDECSFNPCLNGECTNTNGSFSCACQEGWGGALCDSPIYCDTEDDVGNANWPRTRVGSTATGFCLPGFQSSSPSRPCTQPSNNALVGDWGSVSSPCTSKKCPSLDTTRTTWPQTVAGLNATGTCKSGFVSSSSPVRFCDYDGVFSAQIFDPCEPTYCDAHRIENEHANFTRTQSGRYSIGICDAGYFGAPRLNCTIDGENAVWATTVDGTACQATNKAVCPTLTEETGNYTFVSYSGVEEGTTGKGTCPPGQVGSPSRLCQQGGVWGPVVNPCVTLGPVRNLRVTKKTSTSIHLAWDAGVNSKMYRILFSSDGKDFFIVSNGAGDDWPETNFLIEFLFPFTQYYFKVISGYSSNLYEAQGTLLVVKTGLPVVEVTAVNTTSVSNSSTIISWPPVANVDWYNVFIRLVLEKRAIGTEFTLAEGGLKYTGTSFQFNGLEYASLYQVKIVSGKTEGGADIFTDDGALINFETPGRIAPTEAPTELPTVAPTEPPNLVPAIAGGAGGGAAVLLFLIILIAFYVRSKKKEKKLYDLQMADLPPSSAFGASDTSLINRAGGTKTLTRTHTLTRPSNAGEGNQASVTNMSSQSGGGSQFTADPTLMNTVMEISLPGFLLLDYAKDLRIQNRFGNGGSGVVYRATLLDPKLRKQHGVEEVAIKEVVPWEKLSDEENLERFHQEVSLLWSLAFHQNIATLIGYTDVPMTIVTKLYETDLFQFLQNPDEDVDSSIAVLVSTQIAAGLSAMHNMGMIHRDVKSANVLLETVSTDQGVLLNACLCDFGLARVTQESKLFNQKFSTVVGLSPRYAAPEVFARSHLPTLVPDPEEEKKADVFAFGVIVWECMTRDVPWEDTPNEKVEVMIRSGKRLQLPETNGDPKRELLCDICSIAWIDQTAKRPSIQDVYNRLVAVEF